VLGRRADEIYAGLEVESQSAARQLFLRLVALGEGTEDTRRRALRSELETLRAGEQMGEMGQVIEAFGRIRLLSFDRDPLSNSPTVEVAHEALLREWPRLHEWLEGSRADLHQQRQLASAAREWLDSGRDHSYLLVEQRLSLFESWAQTTSLALTRDEEEFLHASISLREAQKKAEQGRQAHERKLERRSRRVLAALAVVFLLAALLSGGLAFGVYRQSQEVEKQRQAALRQASVGLAAQAVAELDWSDPERGVLLALEALENYPYTPQAESALAQAAQEVYPYYFLNDKIGLVGSAWFSLIWSPDGKSLFVGSDAVGMLWDVGRRELVGFLPGDLTVSKANEILNGDRYKYSSYYVGMTTAAWSPDGKKIATGRCSFEDFREAGYCGLPRIWDVSTGTSVYTLTEGNTSINSLDWSPDSSLLITANWDGLLIVWDATTGQPVLTLSFENGMGSARWSPDGKTIAIAYEENVAVWSAQDGVELYRLQQTPGADEVFWSPDGKLLATIDGNGDGLVWDLDTRSIRFKLPGELGILQGFAWSGDSRRLMTAGDDGTVVGFDTATGVELFHLHSAARSLSDIAFSPFMNWLAVSSIASFQIQVWDLRPKTETVLPEPVPDWAEKYGWFMPNDLPWSPDGTRLASRGLIWDAASGNQLVKLYNFRDGIVYDEGQLLASREETTAGRSYQAAQNVDSSGYAAWSPDGRMYVSTVYGEAGSTKSAYIWDTETYKIITEIKLEESQQPFTFGWSPDGARLAVTSFPPGKLLYVYDTHNFQELFSVGDGASLPFKPSWSPNGTFLTAGLLYPDPITNTHIIIWDGNTGALVKELPSQDGYTIGANWSPDGKSLAVTYEKGVIKIWDTVIWEPRITFAGHTGAVMWAAWSPDGKRLISCDTSGLIKVWNASDGQEVMSIRASGGVWSVHWSPDGKMISAAGSITLPIIHQAWTSTEDLIAYVKANLVWRELTPEERQQFGLPEKK
jgi:WD40 repeat protein